MLVATVKALKHHGGDQSAALAEIERGAANLARHLGDRPRVRAERGRRGQPLPDRHGRGDRARAAGSRSSAGAYAAEVNDGVRATAATGAQALAEAVAAAADEPNSLRAELYPLDAPIEEKIEAIAIRVYGADGIFLLPTAQDEDRAVQREAGLDTLPICMAKTHLSLSHDPALTNAPTGFTVPVRDLRAYTGAGWLVALCGDMQTMPGLGATPAAFNVDIDDDGRTVGLF